MSNPQTLGLALIAKDEADSLPHLLASVEGAFDQVALLDTGSADRTVEIFEEWAKAEKARHPSFVSTLGRFEWCDDFAAARNAADDLLETDWLCWADCDDVIVGAQRLRGLLDDADVDEWIFTYRLQQSSPEEPEQYRVKTRDRVRRRGAGQWIARLHEGVPYDDRRRCRQGPTDIEWVHTRHGKRESSGERNTSILKRWVEDEPRNLRPLGMLARNTLAEGRREAALTLFERYVALRYPHFYDEATGFEKETAEWALRELRFSCEHVPPGEKFMESCLPYMVLLLGRRPDGIDGGSIFCREDMQNPEPGHHVVAPKTPKTRQQRRAEARQRAKALQRAA